MAVAVAVALVLGAVASEALGPASRAGAQPAYVDEVCSIDAPLSVTGDPMLAGIISGASAGSPGQFDVAWEPVTLWPSGVKPSGTIRMQVSFTVDADDIASKVLARVISPALASSGASTAAALANSAALTLNLSDFAATIPVPDGVTFGPADVAVTEGGPSAQVDTSGGDLVVTVGDITGSARQPASAVTPRPPSTPPFTVTVGTDVTFGDLPMGTTVFLNPGSLTFGVSPKAPASTGFEITAVDDLVRTAGADASFTCTFSGSSFPSVLVNKLAPYSYEAFFLQRQYEDFENRGFTTDEANAFYARLAGSMTAADFITDLRRNTNGVNSDALTVVDPVARLYFAYFGRSPDAGGLAYWLQRKRAGRSLASISSSFAGSSEFKTKYGSLTNRQFVTRLYTDVLGRAPDASGVDFWTSRLDRKVANRGGVMTGFSESSEYKRKKADAVDVAVVWTSMMRARPSTADFDEWVAALGGSSDVGDLIDHLLATPAYEATAAR